MITADNLRYVKLGAARCGSEREHTGDSWLDTVGRDADLAAHGSVAFSPAERNSESTDRPADAHGEVGPLIHFVVVTGDRDRVERLAPRLLRAVGDTRVFDGHELVATAPSGTWAVAALTAPDPGCITRFAARGDTMALVNGPALASGGDQRALIESVLDAYATGGSEAVEPLMGGAYNFVGISPDHGASAYVDFSGLYPLYYAQATDVVVFSNRSTSVARVADIEGWDERALGWLIGHANLYGDRMPARGVSYLPPGREANVRWGTHVVNLRRSPSWVWPPPSAERGRDNLSPAEWDDVTEGLVANMRALRNVSGSPRLALTGGKDSRLLLALAKAAGLESSMETSTRGTEQSPEVEVARIVAGKAGFEHRHVDNSQRASAQAGAPSGFDAEVVWRRLRQHAHRYEYVVCPWAGMNDRLRGTSLRIEGFGGELYRRGTAKRFRVEDPKDPASMAVLFENYQQRHDPLGLLTSAEREFQKAFLHEWVHRTAEDVRLDLLPEKFYVDYRLGHWNGPMGQGKAGSISMNPLLSSSAFAAVMQLSPRSRGGDQFHFEVMRRAAPELTTIPFLGDTWGEPVLESSSLDLPTEPFPTGVKVSQRALTSWQFPFLEHGTKSIRRLFRQAHRRSNMDEICDMQKLVRMDYWTETTRAVEGRAIVSCIAIAHALLGRAEAVADDVLFGDRRRGPSPNLAQT